MQRHRQTEPGRGPGEAHNHAHAEGSGRLELGLSLACGVLLLAGWLLERSSGEDARGAWLLYVGAYANGGFFAVREALEHLRDRALKIDALMLVAAAGAAVLGQWAEGALLLFLFSLGHALENYAMGRARRAIEALAALRPESALVRRNGALLEVEIDALQVGDIVVGLIRELEQGLVVNGD